MKTSDFKELKVWQKAIDLTVAIYSITKQFPPEEKFGICSQMRRSAVSIPSNIAEGHGRSTKNDYFHFLSIARGSVCELQTQLIISEKLEFISREDNMILQNQLTEIDKMLVGVMSYLKPNT